MYLGRCFPHVLSAAASGPSWEHAGGLLLLHLGEGALLHLLITPGSKDKGFHFIIIDLVCCVVCVGAKI